MVAKEHLQNVSQAFVTIKGQRLLTWGEEEEEEEEGVSRGIYPGKSPPEVPCKIVSIKVKTTANPHFAGRRS